MRDAIVPAGFVAVLAIWALLAVMIAARALVG